MKHTRRMLGLAVAAAAVAVPATAAHAAKLPVAAGPPPAIAKKLPAGATDNAFYPRTITVHKGDRVKFTLFGFHQIYFPKKGGTAPALALADPARPVAGVVDAAGNPFFFNGLPGAFVEPSLLAPLGDGKINGKSVDSLPIPAGPGAATTYTATFTKRGTYSYFCAIHPGMKGTVKVVGKAKKRSTRKTVKKAVAKQGAKAIKQATKLAGFAGPAAPGVQAGNDNTHIVNLSFFPANRTVAVGTTVTFSMPKVSSEIHNVAFGDPTYLQGLIAGFIAPGPTGVALDPRTVYPSDPALVLDGTNHGNGFVNTGLLDTDPNTPFPAKASITFAKAGTYEYVCVVHGPEMKGTITVQ
jgi:plastocyanin